MIPSPRLAYLLKKFPRTSETFVLNEMLGQERLGLPLHVFSRRPPDDEPRHPQLADLRANVETLPRARTIDPWQLLFSRSPGKTELFDRVRAVVHSSEEWNHPRFPSLLVEALHLLRRTAELEIEHVHSHFATDSAVVAMLLHALGGPTYSLTLHAKDIYRNGVRPAMLDALCGRAEFAVTVCDANVEYLGQRLNGWARSRLRRLYNGIDLSRFTGGARGERSHVLAVGRLVEKKGFHVLLEALALLAREGVDVRTSIVGEGDQRPRLSALIDELGLAGRVRLLGAMDQDRVRELMGRATVLCQPSMIGGDGNRDALPTVLLEALACGLPTVSTPIAGIPEILDGGRVGKLVPPNDPAALARALRQVLDDEALRRRLAAAGRRHAEERFDAETNALVLNGWFGEALRESRLPCESPA